MAAMIITNTSDAALRQALHQVCFQRLFNLQVTLRELSLLAHLQTKKLKAGKGKGSRLSVLDSLRYFLKP